uniref:Polyadenylate-binding protein, cytoplasmic and nuclear n=1 Tax=Lygus hesperus TaxID=30085 RepID=A0A0A9W6F6_LYGHE
MASIVFSFVLFGLFGFCVNQPSLHGQQAPYNPYGPYNYYQPFPYLTNPQNGLNYPNQNYPALTGVKPLYDPNQYTFGRRQRDYSQYYRQTPRQSTHWNSLQDVDTVSDYDVSFSTWLRDIYYAIVVLLAGFIFKVKDILAPITALFSG